MRSIKSCFAALIFFLSCSNFSRAMEEGIVPAAFKMQLLESLPISTPSKIINIQKDFLYIVGLWTSISASSRWTNMDISNKAGGALKYYVQKGAIKAVGDVAMFAAHTGGQADAYNTCKFGNYESDDKRDLATIKIIWLNALNSFDKIQSVTDRLLVPKIDGSKTTKDIKKALNLLENKFNKTDHNILPIPVKKFNKDFIDLVRSKLAIIENKKSKSEKQAVLTLNKLVEQLKIEIESLQ